MKITSKRLVQAFTIGYCFFAVSSIYKLVIYLNENELNIHETYNLFKQFMFSSVEFIGGMVNSIGYTDLLVLTVCGLILGITRLYILHTKKS